MIALKRQTYYNTRNSNKKSELKIGLWLFQDVHKQKGIINMQDVILKLKVEDASVMRKSLWSIFFLFFYTETPEWKS